MSKGKRYCSIQKWIEENDKKLFDFLEDNCLLGIFKFRHGTSGVTFLHPKNWKDIEKDIESGDYVNGVNTLKAHVLQGYYPNLDGLIEQQDGLVNALGQLVEVDKKAGNVVQLKNKAKVSESKFAGTPDRTNINVFHYDGDLLPTNGPAGSLKYTSAPSGKKSKSGGGFSGMNKLSKTKMVEQCALNLIRQQAGGGVSYMNHNPYAAAVVSLYSYAKANSNQHEQLKPLLDVFPENAYYAIVLPYGPDPTYQPLINSWLEETGGIYAGSNPCDDYKQILDKVEKKGEAEAMSGPPDKLMRSIERVYGKGLSAKLRGDELRWFITLRRVEDPALFSNHQKFITLVYDLAVLFSSPEKSAWLSDTVGDGSLFAATRYFNYNFCNSVPADAMKVTEALSGRAPDRTIAADEAQQLVDLAAAAGSGKDDWHAKYEIAKAAYQQLHA